VFHNIKKTLVARIGIKNLSEEKLAKVAVEIARFYHDAKIAPEVNYSHAICDYIVNTEGYKNVYITESMTRIDRKKESMEYGWNTTSLTKPPAISALRAHLREHPEAIPDKEFWYEAEYYVIENMAKNIMNAASGHFDDIIMSCAIGFFVSNSFQSKQVYSHRVTSRLEKNKSRGIMLGEPMTNMKKKSTKLKKGVYTNHA